MLCININTYKTFKPDVNRRDAHKPKGNMRVALYTL